MDEHRAHDSFDKTLLRGAVLAIGGILGLLWAVVGWWITGFVASVDSRFRDSAAAANATADRILRLEEARRYDAAELVDHEERLRRTEQTINLKGGR